MCKRAQGPWEHTRKEDAAPPRTTRETPQKPMDITRNWRLKTTRSRLLATRDPLSGAVMLPQHTASAVVAAQDVYRFESAPERSESQGAYARALR